MGSAKSILKRGTLFSLKGTYYKVTSITRNYVFARNMLTRKEESLKIKEVEEAISKYQARNREGVDQRSTQEI